MGASDFDPDPDGDEYGSSPRGSAGPQAVSLEAMRSVAVAEADELRVDTPRQGQHLDELAHLRRRGELLRGARGTQVGGRLRIAAARERVEHSAIDEELRLRRKAGDRHS